ncbi:MAG: AAA family ATPase [Candidatus Eremiobacterota bacterium]
MVLTVVRIRNFKGFENLEVNFDPEFNLLYGENGSGKTSALDALAVSIGSWFLGIKGAKARHIQRHEIRIQARTYGEEVRFEESVPVEVDTDGRVCNQEIQWRRTLETSTGRTTSKGARQIKSLSAKASEQATNGEPVALPLVSYYGTGRLWREPRDESPIRSAERVATQKPSRLDGYRNSIDPRLSVRDLVRWIARQSWIGYQRGQDTQVFKAVRSALVQCIDGGRRLYFDAARGEVLVEIERQGVQPFANLSDGQRAMLAMVGDLAQKAVQLNPHMGARALTETTGVVLIDELDLHLHPRWQRRVVQDLRQTFPMVQFFATTHSPQIIGQVRPEQLFLLSDGCARKQTTSFGLDSNSVLKYLMDAPVRDPGILSRLESIEGAILEKRFEDARSTLLGLREEMGQDRELTRYEGILNRYADTK